MLLFDRRCSLLSISYLENSAAGCVLAIWSNDAQDSQAPDRLASEQVLPSRLVATHYRLDKPGKLEITRHTGPHTLQLLYSLGTQG